MSKPSESIRDLATRLLAAEADGRSGEDPHEAVIVFEKLRASLTRFSGADGFTALARRAFSLAVQDVPDVKDIVTLQDGRLGGLERLTDGDRGAEAAEALTIHLLSLLVTFVGEPITLRLVRESWPDV